jgi:hypothetical protein
VASFARPVARSSARSSRRASRRVPGGLLQHGKTMTVDGVCATIGSTNLDTRLFALNEELNAVQGRRGPAREDLRRRSEVLAEDRRREGRDQRVPQPAAGAHLPPVSRTDVAARPPPAKPLVLDGHNLGACLAEVGAASSSGSGSSRSFETDGKPSYNGRNAPQVDVPIGGPTCRETRQHRAGVYVWSASVTQRQAGPRAGACVVAALSNRGNRGLRRRSRGLHPASSGAAE